MGYFELDAKSDLDNGDLEDVDQCQVIALRTFAECSALTHKKLES